MVRCVRWHVFRASVTLLDLRTEKYGLRRDTVLVRAAGNQSDVRSPRDVSVSWPVVWLVPLSRLVYDRL